MQKSLEIDPDYHEVYFNLGNLVSDEGKYEEAAALYARSEFPASLPHVASLYIHTLSMQVQVGHEVSPALC